MAKGGRGSRNPDSSETSVAVDGVKAALREAPLFFVFKYLLSLIRRQTEGMDEFLRNELMTEWTALILEAAQDRIRCIKCQDAVQFRHCKNPGPSDEIVHVLELTCERCGDVFTLAENRNRVSYFNAKHYPMRTMGTNESDEYGKC